MSVDHIIGGSITQGLERYVGIEPIKVRHDVTKLNLTIPLLPIWYIDIDLSIQLIYLALYIICVH